MADISVIVPCYNVSWCVFRCIESLIKQTIGLERLEIILVDDASTDDGKTLAELMKYEALYPDNIMVIPLKENMRQGGARNIGISYASGEFILFCDADDWIHETTIERLYAIAKDYDCDVVEYGANIITSFDNIPEPSRIENAGDVLIDIKTDEFRGRYLLSRESTFGCMYKLYKSKLLKDNDIYFPEHVFLEEPGFIFLTRLYEKRHYILQERLHYNYLSPNSTMRGSFSNKRFDNMFTYIHFMDEVKKRDIYNKYKTEIEFFFWKGCFFKTLALAASAGEFFNKEEFAIIQNNTAREIPDIRQNEMYKQEFCLFPAVASLTYCSVDDIDMEQIKLLILTVTSKMH